MPLYTFKCPKGHEHEALVKLSDADAVRYCPHEARPEAPACGELTIRIPSANAKLFPGADSWRR